MAVILNHGTRPTSDKVVRVTATSGTVDNIGLEVEIAVPSLTGQELFPPVLISLTKTKTKMVVNGNTCTSLTKTKIETKILAKTEKKH